MSWEDLRVYFDKFRMEEISKTKLAMSIYLYQRSNGIEIEDRREVK